MKQKSISEELDEVDDQILQTMTRALLAAKRAYNREMRKYEWDITFVFEGRVTQCYEDGKPCRSIELSEYTQEGGDDDEQGYR